MSYIEKYNSAKRALARAHERLERIADERQRNIEKIRRRRDLDAAMVAKLVEAVNTAAAREFREARKEVEKQLDAARDAVRKGRRADSHWDTATELRVNGAIGRMRPFLDDPEAQLHKVVESLADEAVQSGDRATIIALRRELGAAARRRGLPPTTTEQLLEKLDLLTEDSEIGLSVSAGRELPKLERGVGNLLSSFEADIAGKSPANVYLDGVGGKRFRNGWAAGEDGSVIAPVPATVEQQTAAEVLDEEYERMFGPFRGAGA